MYILICMYIMIYDIYYDKYILRCLFVCVCGWVSKTLRWLPSLHVIFGGSKHEKSEGSL